MDLQIYNTKKGIIVKAGENYYLSKKKIWARYINRNALNASVNREIASLQADISLKGIISKDILPPLSIHEVWASGVTYLRSREARMEESKEAGGGDFYSKVYEADRPELFFKSTGARAVGTGEAVRIRKDSKWNVPEPELTLFITTKGKIVGYTCGNDMSSRDIEGENPLYLPQAKTYDKSAALGPCLFVPQKPISSETDIAIQIKRNGKTVFDESIKLNRMKRKLKDLAAYLCRELSFPNGVFLMTGTGIVPPNDFTLAVGDMIDISISGIGTLSNVVDSG